MTAAVPRLVRLLVVDQSPTCRERLRRLFDSVADIDVVAETGSPEKTMQLLETASPTAALVGCDLPEPGSFSLVRDMMSQYRVPIVMMTKLDGGAAAAIELRALDAGAVALVSWPAAEASAGARADQALVRTIRAMSEVKVVRRREHRVVVRPPARAPLPGSLSPVPSGGIDLVAIGASTGGPPVLQTILCGFSRPLPVPVLLVQHLTRGFKPTLIGWLAESTRTTIQIGQHGMVLSAGVVYLAPDDRHMVVDSSGRLALTDDPPENASRPSVSVLFRSVAQLYGPRAIGILLTGMGRDGAKELRLMRDSGAVTIAQDEESSVVHGMPGEAIKLKGARYILAPDRIASVLEHYLLGPQGVHREPGQLPMAAC